MSRRVPPNIVMLLAAGVAVASFASQAQIYKCLEGQNAAIKYQQMPCAPAAESRLVEPKHVPVAEQLRSLGLSLTEIDERIARKYPDYKRVFGSGFSSDACRKVAGIRSRYELSSDWKPVREEAIKSYEHCVDQKAQQLDTDIKKSAADARWQSQLEKKQAQLPFPKIGMNAHAVRTQTSLGAPEKVNSTTTARGRREQWVYGAGTYLYFDNDVLTAIQSR